MKKSGLLYLLTLVSVIFSSCDLQHLDLSKFTKLDHLSPSIYLPISSGDYLIKDYVSIPETGNQAVSSPQIKLTPIVYDLSSLIYNIDAVDSFFVQVRTINNCPMQLQYSLSFDTVKLNSGLLPGGTLDVAGHVTASSEKTVEFSLSNADFRKFNQAASMTLTVTLSQPAVGPVIANDLKTGKITVYIAYRASLNILKL